MKKYAVYSHGVYIKLTNCGGLTLGCLTESTVGISAIGHFLLPWLDYIDMNMLIKNDIVDGARIYDKKVHFPERNEIGAELLQ